MVFQIILLAAIVVPIFSGVICLLWQSFSVKTAQCLTAATAVLELVFVSILFAFGDGTQLSLPFVQEMGFSLQADGLGRFFALLVGVVWLMVAIYSFPYIKHEGAEKRFFGFFLCTLGAVVGIGYSGNMLTLYLFFEAMTLASVPLVMHNLSAENRNAAGAYLIYSVFGATLGLIGSIFFTMNGGGENFFTPRSGAPLVIPTGSEPLFILMGFLTIVGFCCKAGLAPFHVWLPFAHPVAPAPASAVLSGIITKCGAIAAVRVIFCVVGVDILAGSWAQYTLIIMALFTVLLGSTLAYSEGLLKKRLAYSSVSQLSYLLVGVFLMSAGGMLGALLQMLFHALAKVVLFLCAGAIILLLHKKQVNELNGIGKQLPAVMVCFTAASLSLVGIPPFGGAISKWQLAVAGLEADMGALSYAIPAVLIISALLTAGYLFSIVQNAFFGELPEADAVKAVKTPLTISLPLAVLSSGLLIFGCFSAPIIKFLNGAIASII